MSRRLSRSEGDPSAVALLTEMDSEAETEKNDDNDDDKENNNAAAVAAAAATSPSSASALFSEAASEATCGICLELVAAAHAVTTCCHVFCGACLLQTIETSSSTAPTAADGQGPRLPPRCPQCRSSIRTPPVRVRMIDKVVSAIVRGLPDDEERASWRARVSAFDATSSSSSSTATADGENNDRNRNRNRNRLPTAADAERICAAAFGAPLRVPPSQEEAGDEGEEEGADPPVDEHTFLPPRPPQRRRRADDATSLSSARAWGQVAAHMQAAVDREETSPDAPVRAALYAWLRTPGGDLESLVDRQAARAREELERAAARGGGG